jgi:hypothetical protein
MLYKKQLKTKLHQVEYRIEKSDLSTAFIQEQAHLVSDDKGNITYIDGVFILSNLRCIPEFRFYQNT